MSGGNAAHALFEIRRLSGLTWQELADLFGVSRRTVHNWANGARPSAEHKRAIFILRSTFPSNVARTPLSPEADAARRPPAPWVLLDALQDGLIGEEG
ncbi:MAG: helix-turn-helix transcriptional regulator [Alphaproteobacteria bacterium]|nr:helix-turn-helix transcriptional regulator [Alphaproteobacteria bacterium]